MQKACKSFVLDASSHRGDTLPPWASLEPGVGNRSGLHTGNRKLLRDNTRNKSSGAQHLQRQVRKPEAESRFWTSAAAHPSRMRRRRMFRLRSAQATWCCFKGEGGRAENRVFLKLHLAGALKSVGWLELFKQPWRKRSLWQKEAVDTRTCL